MPPVRVLHLARVVNRYDWIDTVVRYLSPAQFTLEVATFEAQANIQDPAYEEVGIPHHIIPVKSIRAYPAYVQAAVRLARLLRRRQIHILHTHHYWEGVVGAMAKALYPNFTFLLHRHYTEDLARVHGLKGWLLRRLESWSYTKADRLLVPTETMRAWVIAFEKRHLPPIEVIPYGFELEAPKYKPLSAQERQAVRTQAAVGAEEVVIANVGSHRRQKGQLELVRAFSRLVRQGLQVRLWLIGAGPDTAALQEAAKPLGDRVKFWGWQRAQAVRALMGAADIIAHPTYSEAFPQVMVEALALERPLVITPVSGARDYLQPDIHACFVPTGDENALYEALYKLTTDPNLRAQLAQAGAHLVRTHFSYKAVNRQYEALYTQLCSLSR